VGNTDLSGNPVAEFRDITLAVGIAAHVVARKYLRRIHTKFWSLTHCTANDKPRQAARAHLPLSPSSKIQY